MRPLRYSINLTLDGCCDHRDGVPDEELRRIADLRLPIADLRNCEELGLEGTLPSSHDRRGKEIRCVEHPGPGRLERPEPDWHQLVRGDLGKAVQQLTQAVAPKEPVGAYPRAGSAATRLLVGTDCQHVR